MEMGRPSYFTRSARLKECKGWQDRPATSLSAIVVELGGWDHLCAEGEGCRLKLTERVENLDCCTLITLPFLNCNGRGRHFMVAFDRVCCST